MPTFFTLKKTVNLKMSGQKTFILSKDVNSERILKSKPKKQAKKGPFFGAPLFRQLQSNGLYFFFRKCSSYDQIFTRWKISLLTSLQAEMKGGGGGLQGLWQKEKISKLKLGILDMISAKKISFVICTPFKISLIYYSNLF